MLVILVVGYTHSKLLRSKLFVQKLKSKTCLLTVNSQLVIATKFAELLEKTT